MISLIFFHTKF